MKHTSCNFAEGHCGAGFVHRNGELQFTRYSEKMKRLEEVNSIHECRNFCIEESRCCSFEFNYIIKRCNLLSLCEPTKAKFISFEFCTKGKGMQWSALPYSFWFNLCSESHYRVLLRDKSSGGDHKKWRLENGLLMNKLYEYPVLNTKHISWGNPTNPDETPWTWSVDYNSKNSSIAW